MTLRTNGKTLQLVRNEQTQLYETSAPTPSEEQSGCEGVGVRVYGVVRYDHALSRGREETSLRQDEELLQQARERVGAGADINQIDSEGYTLFHRACFGERWDVVAWLLAHGADPKIKTPFGLAPSISVEAWRDGQKVRDMAQDIANFKRKT
jgi:Ankyrin repeats (many copies)